MEDKLQINSTFCNNTLIIKVDAIALEFFNSTEFEVKVIEEIKNTKEFSKIILDLTCANSVSSIIISVLLKISREYYSHYDIKILVNNKILKMFQMLDIISLLNIYQEGEVLW